MDFYTKGRNVLLFKFSCKMSLDERGLEVMSVTAGDVDGAERHSVGREHRRKPSLDWKWYASPFLFHHHQQARA
jgi:hypothetical protein